MLDDASDSATKIVKDLLDEGLTVETGLTAVAEAMTKNAIRSSSLEFTEYIIHEDISRWLWIP